jgi:hypothetical protein
LQSYSVQCAAPAPSDRGAILTLVRQRREAGERATKRFVEAFATANIPRLSEALVELDDTGSWRPAMRRVSRLDGITRSFQEHFCSIWIANDDDIRDAINDDGTLLNALRVLLPRYEGGNVLLYRGDGFSNRCRRTYGMSWSASEAVADGFARGVWQEFVGGSVLLQTLAPAEAIISAPCFLGEDECDELEYVVDRRKLGKVNVLRRYPQRAAS